MSPRGIARNIGSRAPGLLSSGVSAGSRPLGDESEPVVRLLACAYQVISKRLGDSRSSGKPGVPAAAAPAAPFTRKRRRPARSGRGQSASGPRAVPCPKRRRAGADRCTRIWANVSARPGWRRGGRHRRSERPHGGYLGRMRASRNPRKAGAHPAAVGCPRRGERGLGADWTDVRRTRAFVAVSPGTNRQCNEATTAGSVFGSYRRDRASCLHGRWRNRAEALRGSVTSSVESDLCACCRWNRLWRA